MTLLYTDPAFLEHQTPPHHPERPERLLAITRQLDRAGLRERCSTPTWQAATNETLGIVHDLGYLQKLEALVRRGGGRLDEDTTCCERSWDVASLAAGATVDAVTRVIQGEDRQAMCLVRPPGHHALADRAMGFCLLGNVALGARYATQRLDVNRVLIVDWDVHHGNGTQDMLWEDPQIGYLSIHRWPFYPGTGSADETGSGDGLGTTLNIPLEYGTPRREFLSRFCAGLEQLAAKIRPELVIISAGFDAHCLDPVGDLGLETEDFAVLTQAVLEIANRDAGGRVVSVLEGGYNTSVLAGCVALHLETLLEKNHSRG